jgi:hypothetical protein
MNGSGAIGPSMVPIKSGTLPVRILINYREAS